MAKELSGRVWVARYPDAGTTDVLDSSFRTHCERFITAMKAAGIDVKVSSTRRPKERAWLMHYCWRVHRRTLLPQNVPARPGIDIEWVHRDGAGKVNLDASRRAASEMVTAYGIAYPPALASMHTRGLAIDMTLAWHGTVKVAEADGSIRLVKAPPGNGFNLALRQVGKSYGVVKNPKDPPHWSTNGH